jgi:hypothetical protein
MSGGYFNYGQYRCYDIAEYIEELISTNEDASIDEWGDRIGRFYPPEVIEKFKEAAYNLRRAGEMAQRVDYLVSSDDGEAEFLKRWKEEVRGEYKKS